MEKIELQKKYERIKALITVAQILLCLLIPCLISFSNMQQMSRQFQNMGIVILLGSVVLLSIYRKKIKLKLQKITLR